ncbi:hypothetical protein NPIL_389571, partial [Nephila pilipes]
MSHTSVSPVIVKVYDGGVDVEEGPIFPTLGECGIKVLGAIPFDFRSPP